MKHLYIPMLCTAMICNISLLQGQHLTQTVRGTVNDKVSQAPLPGANVVIPDTDPMLGATTDIDGNFRILNVPVGTHKIKVSFIGYKEIALSNIVNSGKELVLTISIEEDITHMQEVVVTADNEKNSPINDMTAVSARTFSVEETRKYAASVNDPGRMIVSYSGVVQTDDGNNSVSIRGNAPFGLLWRMEGVDIPNPNHFGDVGSSGGGICILSAQLLSNSDFMTSAFPAEYGNALSGVFDLHLRKGNNEKTEFTFQAGLLGIDAAAEGPFSKKYKGSYLINYRYSTLALLTSLGFKIGDGVTRFQDLSYNIFLPTNKLGNFYLFGFGGLSSENFEAERDSTLWSDSYSRYDSRFHSNTAAAGVRNVLVLNGNSYLQSAVVISGNNNGYEQKKLNDEYVPMPDYKESYGQKKITLSSVLNNKLSAKSNLRSGVYLNRLYYDFYQRAVNDETKLLEERIHSDGNTNLIQLFSQWSYRASETVTFNAGLHYIRLLMNNTYSVDPRASIKYNFSEAQSLSLGYGHHGQIQPLGVYFAQRTINGIPQTINKDLGFNKSHHLVLAYDRSLNNHLRIKTEAYYQHLFNLAISPDPTDPLAIINEEEGYITDSLVNKGVGRNYGLELTLEQFLFKRTYFLLSSSLYDSKYKAADHQWRNTRYNGNFAFSFTGGKEIQLQRQKKLKQKTLGINIRALYVGGLRSTPIDHAASVAEGETEFIQSEAYSTKGKDYFRTDLRISLKVNRPRLTSTLALDIQNVTNHQNVFGEYFDAMSGEVKVSYQAPLIPVLSYKIEF